MQSVPGVQSAAIVAGLPMGEMMLRTTLEVEGQPESRPSERRTTDVAFVTPGYFTTLGIALKRGRDVSDADRSGAPIVSVVNEEFVRRYFPNEDAIGKRIELGWTQDTAATGPAAALGGTIVGVVGNVKRAGLAEEVRPETYAAYMQPTFPEFAVVVRSTADPSTVIAAARAQMRALDADLPISGLRELSELISRSVAQPRFYTLLLGAFAAIALLLAAVGIYGVISYAVSLRTRELGIRLALGATGRHVSRLVLREGVGLAVGGVVIGGISAFWLSRLLTNLLFGVSTTDPATFLGVSAVLMAIAALACLVPARRAARVDPVTAMRNE